MALQEQDLARITERLAADFQEQIPRETLVTVLRACADSNPTDPPEVIEQTTRIRLQIRRQGHSN